MPMHKAPYRIVIADDQPMAREGLKLILESGGDMRVVGEARNGLEASELAQALLPDLVLMDVRMPVMDGIAGLKRIKREHPETRVVILSTFAEDDDIVEGLANGASGYLLKDMEGERLVAAVREAVTGQFVLQGIVAEKLAMRVVAPGREPDAQHGVVLPGMPRMTDREFEVARLLVQGCNNREIGRRLQITDGTVRNYISVLYGKLGVNGRAQAIVRLLPFFES